MEDPIPIDYIAGTSMGALVGGLHATGLTSAEIRDFASRVDLGAGALVSLAVSGPGIPSQRRPGQSCRWHWNRTKRLETRVAVRPLGRTGVGLVLARFAAPYGHMRSFDDLPTPSVVHVGPPRRQRRRIDQGSLFDALRATMSLAASFTVTIDGMVLVDGALTNNLPVDVVKGMGADYTIAVALDYTLKSSRYSSRFLGVAGSSISYMITEKERTQMAAADLVVMPLLKGLK